MRMLSEALGRRLLLADAPIEGQLRKLSLDAERDFFGAQGCMAVLSLTRARLVRDLHKAQLLAGADLVRANSADGSPLELRGHGLEEDAFAISYAAAELAVAAVDAVPGEGRRRFAVGVLRDGGWDASAEELEAASALQASALLAGGVDGLAIEAAPYSCRAPVMLRGAERARAETGSAAAIFLLLRAEGPAALARSHRAIRYRQMRPQEAEAAAHFLRTAELLGGVLPEDTAALDGLLREMAGEELRPPLPPSEPRQPAPAPAAPPAEGVVLFRAGRWSR
jgi:methionine synthase I (cobalamin-dependent)